MITLVFTRRSGSALSWFIRAATMCFPKYTIDSGWSHVAILVGEGEDTIIDSVMGKGVRMRTLRSLISTEGVEHEVRYLKTLDDPAEGWLIEQIGKRYDYSALWAFLVPSWIPWRRQWQESDCWFCAELAAAWAAKHGAHMPRNPRFMSPNDLAALCVKH